MKRDAVEIDTTILSAIVMDIKNIEKKKAAVISSRCDFFGKEQNVP